jgi:cytochrome c
MACLTDHHPNPTDTNTLGANSLRLFDPGSHCGDHAGPIVPATDEPMLHFRRIDVIRESCCLTGIDQECGNPAIDAGRTMQSGTRTMRLTTTMLVLAAVIGSQGSGSAQDVAAGEKVFAKCKICHQVGEGARNLIGPELNGIVGRKAGSVEGYSYTEANKNSGITWDDATLKEYLKNPKAKMPGTKMIFAGLPKDEEIDNVIAYLKQFGPDGKKI